MQRFLRSLLISVISFVVVGLMMLALSVAAESQSPSPQQAIGQIVPMLMDIRQRVPISLTVSVPMGGGESMEVIVPLELDLSLQVSIADTVEAKLDVGQVEDAQIVVTKVTATPTPAQAEDVLVPAEGVASAIVNGVEWTILEVQDMGGVLKSSNAFMEDLKSKGRFIRIRLSLNNQTKEALNMMLFSANLLDDSGRTFGLSPEIAFQLENYCTGINTINPGLSKECEIAIEVPSDAKHLQLQVNDFGMFDPDTKLIDLGMDE